MCRFVSMNLEGIKSGQAETKVIDIRTLQPPAKHVVATMYVDFWVFKYYPVNPLP